MAGHMLDATEIRIGNVVRSDGKACKVLTQEVKGTGKFGKTVHMKMKSLEDGHIHEKSLRAGEQVEEVDVEHSIYEVPFIFVDQGLDQLIS